MPTKLASMKTSRTGSSRRRLMSSISTNPACARSPETWWQAAASTRGPVAPSAWEPSDRRGSITTRRSRRRRSAATSGHRSTRCPETSSGELTRSSRTLTDETRLDRALRRWSKRRLLSRRAGLSSTPRVTRCSTTVSARTSRRAVTSAVSETKTREPRSLACRCPSCS